MWSIANAVTTFTGTRAASVALSAPTAAGADLSFNYRLRPGICQQKNATCIMKKMGSID
jgi:hypothetical protein